MSKSNELPQKTEVLNPKISVFRSELELKKSELQKIIDANIARTAENCSKDYPFSEYPKLVQMLKYDENGDILVAQEPIELKPVTLI